MIKVKWVEEEAVALFNLYFKEGINASEKQIVYLSEVYRNRARLLGIRSDEKYRNVHGLKMQLACIHYVVTVGHEGMSNASKLFYATYEMYLHDRERFDMILKDFIEKYGI